MTLDPVVVQECVRRALAEDLGEAGDVTSQLSVAADAKAHARLLTKESGVLAGLPVAIACLQAIDVATEIDPRCEDGQAVEPGQVVLEARGTARALLAAERTALNFLQRLSGIATGTRKLVEAVAGTGARILDTRKTTPGLRLLEKYAVACGGGENHRFGLYDQVLLKENHFALAAPTPYEDVVRHAVASSSAPVVAEARTLDEALAAVRGGAAVILLDNFAAGEELQAAVRHVRAVAGSDVELEASGGITLGNARAFAECGVDRLSVGALTHSVRALDLSMLLEPVR